MLTAGRLRDEFELPGISHRTATLFRDKIAMKEAVAELGVPVPRFSQVESQRDLHMFLQEVGRGVVKRVNFTGGMDVHVVDIADNSRNVWTKLTDDAGYEVEEYIDGPMYHCDSVVEEGRVIFSSVSRYLSKPGDFSRSAFGGSALLPHDTSFARQAKQHAARVVLGLGLVSGVTHFEFFWSPARGFVFCEVAARAGGGGISLINKTAFGCDIDAASLLLDAGSSAELSPQSQIKMTACIGLYRSETPTDAEALRSSLHDFELVAVQAFKPEDKYFGPTHCTDYDALVHFSAPSYASLLHITQIILNRLGIEQTAPRAFEWEFS